MSGKSFKALWLALWLTVALALSATPLNPPTAVMAEECSAASSGCTYH